MFEESLGPRGKQTEYLLKSISERLAGREDCKDLTYTVTIDDSGVHMSPLIYVFPNRYNRKEGDRIDIVSFVHKYKMSEVLVTEFVYGTYEYSYVSKKRKWRRLS